ncbi:flagellar basal body P-ring protein FlgI [Rickettsia endosymbiont of Cardiosporidium cionae]|uniref:flagellar basal body P-ring protein FlgI n=1 Tax=Rickettsia endosymbiont of Cardiosporidium cionae TaxID=2777155 RepID=UPI0018954588|nr:flagellar basal body P-ring protein FlgI [Rickettsia endosymbiont of Cardiosporidium cionae]KAF8818566.1 Flagellar P-ring protein [Rickettsia endosymbiont of Cardiosporidium cionae]
MYLLCAVIQNLFICLVYVLGLFDAFAMESRIKDIASVEGVRDNLLVGHGLVVGLNGTGDNLKNAVFTEKGLSDFLDRLGVNVQGSNINTKNIAAVIVTANLPPFATQGNKIDIKVSALGDAKSLKGGVLLATTLLGADGKVYAVAQGTVSISDFVSISPEIKTRNRAIETNGYIQAGAIVENEINFQFNDMKNIRLSLHSPDFSTSYKIANAINNNIKGNIAMATDSATVKITVPEYRYQNLVDLISEIESISVVPDYKAKIVINESTGTIVIGDKVHIRPVAIAQGNLIVNVIQNQYYDSLPFTTSQEDLENINNLVDQRRGSKMHNLEGGAKLSDLVTGLNKLGVWPRDIINILHNIKLVGALDAVIEVR